MGKLSDAKVRGLRKHGRYGDGDGLYLVIRRNGTRAWVLRAVVGRRRRDIGLGGYPATGLKDARMKTQEMLGAIADGRDPTSSSRRSAKPTFAESTREVLEMNRPRWRSDDHARVWLQSLERHAMPTIGNMPIDRIERSDVLEVLKPIWTKIPETARRVRQRMRTIFRWAMSHGYIEHNPAGEAIDGALPPMPKVKAHLRALPYREVPEALKVVEASPASQSSKHCFRFLVLTAARSGEARGAVWDEIDLDGALWTVPAERMKGGELHRVPLSRQSVEVLNEASALRDDSGLVFPSPTLVGRELSNMTLTKILRATGYAKRATCHGFRTSFREWTLEQADAPWAVAEAALAHGLGNQVEKSYARSDLLGKRRELMQAWADYLLLPTADAGLHGQE